MSLRIPSQHVINSIENVQNEFSLHDIWRIKNPNTRSFTWSKSHPFIFCTLDYWLISDSLNDLVTQVDIQASIKTDHSSMAEFILEDGKVVTDGIPSHRKPSDINLRTENRLMQ